MNLFKFIMEDDGFLQDSSSYNVIIQGFLQNRDSSTAIRVVHEMVSKRFSADLSDISDVGSGIS